MINIGDRTSIFEEVRLQWEGKEYRIPPRDVLRCIAAVEGVITLGELASAAVPGNLPLARLAMAFSTALQFAGADVTDEQVFDRMFTNTGADMKERAAAAAMALHHLMVPPRHMREAEEKVRSANSVEGKANAGGKEPAA